MNVAGPGSERFINPAAPIETAAMITPTPEDWQGTPAEQSSPGPEAAPPLQPAEAAPPPSAPTLPSPPSSLPPPPLVTPASLPTLPIENTQQATPDLTPTRGAGTASTTIFRLERDRLASLYDLNWRRIRLLLWLLAVGGALGFLLLLPPARSALTPLPTPHIPPGSHIRPPTPHRPFISTALFVVGVGAPLLALAIGLTALPALLWREIWLRRQRDLHLAIGRQGLLFFLPSRSGYWFLLPWGHITHISDVTIMPRNGRRARLRTVLWRRLARLRRLFRHGRRLGEAAPRTHGGVRSPFVMHARSQQPRQMLRLVCYAPLPGRGYGWLFRMAPYTRLVGPASFLLETGWFEPIRSPATATPGAGARPPTAPGIFHRLLLNLWTAPLSRAQRPTLPLPRSGGAVILNAAAAPGVNVEARQADRAAQSALPLIPALSISGLIIALATHQPVERAAVLNVATLVILMLGLGLLLAGARRARRGSLFITGAALLALAGLLNLGYGLIAQLADWPWLYRTAPGEPLLFLELLAGLLIALGAGALALEGSGRPGARPAASAGLDTSMGTRPHSAELALTLGLVALGLARMLEDIDRAILSHSGGTALLELRAVLAEPLLPLAIILLSYFAPLAGPALQPAFRALQIIYGLTLALLVPAAFLITQRATQAKGLLPLPWTPLLALELVCGLAIVLASLRNRRSAAAPSPSS
jgi:hypothetical protein